MGKKETSLTDVQNAVVAVNGGKRPAQPVPLLVLVVRQRGVRVLQERDEHQEAVDHQ